MLALLPPILGYCNRPLSQQASCGTGTITDESTKWYYSATDTMKRDANGVQMVFIVWPGNRGDR